ncbi:HNH endonuclease signature motif containing protein [Agromyces ramosus]|uniref:HNH nuclease domain-containing protein n=1 Tax=Agromyces ramosus TaxID=33879 RepID=A0ABU0R6V6_9MICO|nr:HNH endonuclease signature motif containing protein [Agromyces ramosus]MDQ0893805.1 hypothetical protein [Agromyces ramosus]
MTNPLVQLEHDLEALRASWAGALPVVGVGDASSGTAAMSDGGLVQVVTALVQLRRDAESLLAQAAAEVGRRSDSSFGGEGLARQQGFRNPIQFLAAVTGATTTHAAKLIRVGEATRARQSFTGEALPASNPFVADALRNGSISLDAADAIGSMLDRVGLRADRERVWHYEAELSRFASGIPLSLLMRAVKLAEARLDPDGIEPRDEALRSERSLVIHEEPSGMVRFHARLDPVTAAPIKAAIESLVSESLRRRAAAPSATADAVDLADTVCRPVLDDHRTIPQLQADALAELARHALGCTAMPEAAKTTVVVRIDFDALRTGLGDASVDGLDRPISAGAARRLAADAELIPAVLDGESVPLDLGRRRRLFTAAQRIALAERDGGCASCGRNVAYVDAHHIDWWQRDSGGTDLDNGVMLCSFCHHTVHREGWRIRAGRNEVWFIPPPHVDPVQAPRLGGRARFDLHSAPIAAA